MANEYIDRWRLNKPDQLENSGEDQSDEGKSKQETLYPYKQVTAEMQQEMKKNGVDWNMPPNKQKTAEAKIKAQQYSDRAYGRNSNDVAKQKQTEELNNVDKKQTAEATAGYNPMANPDTDDKPYMKNGIDLRKRFDYEGMKKRIDSSVSKKEASMKITGQNEEEHLLGQYPNLGSALLVGRDFLKYPEYSVNMKKYKTEDYINNIPIGVRKLDSFVQKHFGSEEQAELSKKSYEDALKVKKDNKSRMENFKKNYRMGEHFKKVEEVESKVSKATFDTTLKGAMEPLNLISGFGENVAETDSILKAGKNTVIDSIVNKINPAKKFRKAPARIKAEIKTDGIAKKKLLEEISEKPDSHLERIVDYLGNQKVAEKAKTVGTDE